MKTEEELNELKKEVEAVSAKLHDLTEDGLAQVTGGAMGPNISGVIGSAVAAGIFLTGLKGLNPDAPKEIDMVNDASQAPISASHENPGVILVT